MFVDLAVLAAAAMVIAVAFAAIGVGLLLLLDRLLPGSEAQADLVDEDTDPDYRVCDVPDCHRPEPHPYRR